MSLANNIYDTSTLLGVMRDDSMMEPPVQLLAEPRLRLDHPV